MAGFKTHITVSTALGIGYAGAAYTMYGIPMPTCVLAGGLCSVAGMMPDIDSDSGVPLRESLAFAAAIVPMMLVDRLQQLQWPVEWIILAGAGVYLFVRFVVAHLLKKYTVHRGMFHSIPAAFVFGELIYLLAPGSQMLMRCYLGGAVVLGYMSHLCLDEIWSVSFKHGPHMKQSFGTALKFYTTSSMISNISIYGKLLVLTFLAVYEPQFMERVYHKDLQGEKAAITKDLGELRNDGAELIRTGLNAARDATLKR